MTKHDINIRLTRFQSIKRDSTHLNACGLQIK